MHRLYALIMAVTSQIHLELKRADFPSGPSPGCASSNPVHIQLLFAGVLSPATRKDIRFSDDAVQLRPWRLTLLRSCAQCAGALSMAAGEYISVASQKDTELADVDKERQQQEAGPRAREEELEELAQIYVGRGLDYGLAKQVGLLLCPQSCSLRSPALPCIPMMRACKQRPCQDLPSGTCKCSFISQDW